MLNLLYNANIYAYYADEGTNRTGIFFTACELLKTLHKRDDVKLTFYCDYQHYRKVYGFVQRFYPEVRLLTNYNGLVARLMRRHVDMDKQRGFFGKSLMRCLFLFFRFENLFWHHADTKLYDQFDACYTICDPFPKSILASDKRFFVATIHDLIPYVTHMEGFNRNHWLYRLFDDRRPSDRYVCISEYTKKDLVAQFPDISDDHIFINYNGVSDRFVVPSFEASETVLHKYGLKKGKYVFSIGSLAPSKNLKMQIKAFLATIEKYGISDLEYAIAGGSLAGISEEIIATGTERVHFLGYVPDEDVPALYANALFCSFTTLYEGFGLPAIEAMRCGCPLVSSNTTSLPEICGDAAILIDPTSFEEHVEAYRKMIMEPERREQLRNEGFAQAKQFTWENNVDNLIQIIQKVIRDENK